MGHPSMQTGLERKFAPGAYRVDQARRAASQLNDITISIHPLCDPLFFHMHKKNRVPNCFENKAQIDLLGEIKLDVNSA